MAEERITILNRILENIPDSYDKTKGSFFYDVSMPIAMEFESTSEKIEEIKKLLDITNLSDDELETRVYNRTGIVRKEATKATGNVTIIGEVGASISEGDLVSSDTVNFVVTEDKTIDESESMDVSVECEESGTIGNVPAGAIKYFPVTIQGLSSVANEVSITNGYDAESDEDLLIRYFEKLRTPATSGNKFHYKNWAKEITGVGDARIFSLWNGDNTVKVVIIDANKQPADQVLVDEVQEYIDPGVNGLGEGEAPIGAFCTIEAANAVTINVTFTATKDNNYTDSEILENVESNLIDYFKDIAFVETIVSYAKIGATILDTSGLLDYTNLTVNSVTSNISLSDDEVPILGTVTINE